MDILKCILENALNLKSLEFGTMDLEKAKQILLITKQQCYLLTKS